MANLRIKPRAEHWPLYQQKHFRTMPLDKSEKVERMLYIGLAVSVITALSPLLPTRHGRALDYVSSLPASLFVALVIGAGAYHEYLIKPARNHRLGYRLVGQFRVRGKQKLFGKTWLELEPEDLHRVPVEFKVYDRFQKGDLVEVVYSATQDLISVRKIIPPAPNP